MKFIFLKWIARARRAMWTIIVTYMLGMHNFYKGEDKTSDDIVITIDVKEAQGDDAPKD